MLVLDVGNFFVEYMCVFFFGICHYYFHVLCSFVFHFLLLLLLKVCTQLSTTQMRFELFNIAVRDI